MAIQLLGQADYVLPAPKLEYKTLDVRVAATGVTHVIEITPGTTPREILDAIGLQGGSDGFGLSAGQGHPTYELDEDIYPKIPDRVVLWASLPVSVGK